MDNDFDAQHAAETEKALGTLQRAVGEALRTLCKATEPELPSQEEGFFHPIVTDDGWRDPYYDRAITTEFSLPHCGRAEFRLRIAREDVPKLLAAIGEAVGDLPANWKPGQVADIRLAHSALQPRGDVRASILLRAFGNYEHHGLVQTFTSALFQAVGPEPGR